ncbi:anti-sigma factor [Pseudarthrobacter sp. NS4]|uniref:anti-sigma factor n=1 Tax=Pseudarthrobacter sp. NS4 TaxID=2973976 RepID=UPI00216113ED|nr:anti-sigma factor [Pseudarthrobacter sp. NS4]
MRRERQYLERLREAPIPPASDDLTARLLARTSELASASQPAANQPAAAGTAVRVLAMTAGSTVAAAGVLAVGAFAAAGDPVIGTGADTAAALAQVSSQTPADGRALSPEQLRKLRTEGWACPELEAMGFHLESAKAVVIDGQPAVSLRLSDGSHYATVIEQHSTTKDVGGQDPNALQLLGSSPWSVTYRTPGRTFTYESNLPAERADDAVPILQRLGNQAGEGVAAAVSGAKEAARAESLGTRLQRGINNIVARFSH